jgi:hypothetical protein
MSNTTNRPTLKSLAVLVLEGNAAKATDAPKRKARKAAPKADAKGAQPKAELGHKAWNKTLSTKARLAGKQADGTSVYRAVMNAWTDVKVDRDAGLSPDQVLAKFTA